MRLAAMLQATTTSPVRRSRLRWLAGFGLPGVFVYALIDASPLPSPGGTLDVLIVLLAARTQWWWGWYTLVATLGCLAGAWLTYAIGQHGGGRRLQRALGTGRAAEFTGMMQRGGAWAGFLSAVLPPPFPFSIFILTQGAARVSRSRMLLGMGAGRLLRFGLDAYLGYRFGRDMARWLRDAFSPTPAHIAVGLVFILISCAAFWLVLRRLQRGSSRGVSA